MTKRFKVNLREQRVILWKGQGVRVIKRVAEYNAQDNQHVLVFSIYETFF